MGKVIKFLASSFEFAPPPVITLRKVSHAPVLETIVEEEAEEYEEAFGSL